MKRDEYTLISAQDLPKDDVHVVRHLINGAWVDSADGATFERHSPAHGHLVSRIAKGETAETEAAIRAARQTFDSRSWAETSGKERATLLLRVADLIDQNRS